MNKLVPNQQPFVNLRPRIAIIGEAPGADEEVAGRPFVGASGRLLDSVLTSVQILRAGCFVGNVFQYRPPNNDIDLVDKNSPQWHECCDRLRAELRAFAPDLIIALGNTPLNFLTGKSGITKWRGSILDSDFGRVIPALHPAAILREYSGLPLLKFDLAKALYEANNPTPLPSRTFNIDPSLPEILSFILNLTLQKAPTAFDIETVHHQITCLGLCNNPQFVLVIPFDSRWSVEAEAEIWSALATLFESSGVPFVAQNAQYDIGILKWYYNIQVRSLVADTMVMHHACYPEMRKSLAFLASIYTREPYYKWEAKETEGNEQAWTEKVPRDQIYRYNAKDCAVTLECYVRLLVELERHQAQAGFETDMASLATALEMTLRGVAVNHEAAQVSLANIDLEVSKLAVEIEIAFGRPINTKSPKQMKELLYAPKPLGLGFRPVLNRATGAITTNADALIALARRENSPSIQLLLKERQLRTRRSFFTPDCYSDGRLHASFNVCGTETGRWSSSASFLGGRNLMNIPEDCRSIYCADPGYTMIGFDKAQAEARVVAYKAFLNTGSETYKKLIESKQKIHVWFGLRLIDRGICPLSVDEFLARSSDAAQTWYLLAKKSIHGFSYNLGPIKWCDVVASETDGAVIVHTSIAKAIKDALYADLDSIPKWQQSVNNLMATSRTMTTAFGRVRNFFGRGDDLLGEAYAFEPQSTVADDVALSVLRVAKALPQLHLLQTNYDSLLAQCPNDQVLHCSAVIKNQCEAPFTLTSFDGAHKIAFSIPIVLKVGPNWGDLKEIP